MNKARRLPLRFRQSTARRALLSLCLSLLLQGAGAAAEQEISAAEYSLPTRAYPHGALGDDIEWAAIRITVTGQKGSKNNLTHEVKAPPDMVFEDTRPRLWDIDGDGKPEVVTVLSHQQRGAQLAILRYRNQEFTYMAVTPSIGQRFRWLSPVGAGDLDGDGNVEVAYIHTPHLSKTLNIWRYSNGKFSRVARKAGLTNHQIGWDHIPGGLRLCGDVPELITANGDWSRVVATRLENGGILTRTIGEYTGPESLNAALNCP